MKTKFYIFLDIDGVMYDWDYIITQVNSGRIKMGGQLNEFKPNSVNALNYLISQLNKTYDVKLVISSTWRSHMPSTIKVLKDNGLIYSNEFERTPFGDPSKRGEQILEFLKHKQNYKFVIIDDEMFDYKKYFDSKSIIKTEMFHSALSMKDVCDFLNREADTSKQY